MTPMTCDMHRDYTDILNEVYQATKDNFDGSYHNLLWQVMINESCEGAFDVQRSTTPGQLIIALEDGGYIPGLAYFKDDISEDKRNKVVDYLNHKVFNLEPNQALIVICNAMRRSA